LEGSREYVPDYESYDYERDWSRREATDRAERKLLSDWIEPGNACLELGGGYGRLTSVLEQKFGQTVMLDFSRRNIAKASLRLKATGIARGTVGRIPFKDSTFDTVVAVRVLHHVPDLAGVIAEMARVSRDGGCLILGVPNTARVDGPLKNSFVALGPQGHRIYSAPLKAYAHSSLRRVEVRGLGLFDNRVGRFLRAQDALCWLDVATSAAWVLKPEVFMKFRVEKSALGTTPIASSDEGRPRFSQLPTTGTNPGPVEPS